MNWYSRILILPSESESPRLQYQSLNLETTRPTTLSRRIRFILSQVLGTFPFSLRHIPRHILVQRYDSICFFERLKSASKRPVSLITFEPYFKMKLSQSHELSKSLELKLLPASISSVIESASFTYRYFACRKDVYPKRCSVRCLFTIRNSGKTKSKQF